MSERQLVGSYLEAVHLCQEFRIYYQPIVSLETFRITGFEALVHWQSPDHSFISSAELIPVAEEMGLIVPIDWWVLGEACRQIRAWQAKFPINPPLSIFSLPERNSSSAGKAKQIIHFTWRFVRK